MKNCIDFEALIPEYLDGELTVAQAEEFEAHVNDCPSCKKALDEARSLFGDIRSTVEEPPAVLKERVMAAVRSEKRAKPSLRKNLLRAAGALAACLVVTVGILAAFPQINKYHIAENESAVADKGTIGEAEPEFNDGCDEDLVGWGDAPTAAGQTEAPSVDASSPVEALPECEASAGASTSDEYQNYVDGALADESLEYSDPAAADDCESQKDRVEITIEAVENLSQSVSDPEAPDPGIVFMTRGAAELARLIEKTEE